MTHIKWDLVIMSMNRLRELREDNDMTQEMLGQRVGMSAMAISYYEREVRDMKPADICKFCDIFHVTADYFLGRSSNPHATVSDSDTAFLRAYHAAPLEIRKIVDAALEPYKEKNQDAASAS